MYYLATFYQHLDIFYKTETSVHKTSRLLFALIAVQEGFSEPKHMALLFCLIVSNIQLLKLKEYKYFCVYSGIISSSLINYTTTGFENITFQNFACRNTAKKENTRNTK